MPTRTPARSPFGHRLEALEDRSLPSSAFGAPWADPDHLTLSFVPDGTRTPSGAPSVLSQAMSAAGPSAAWKREILRGFQTWAANTNVNIGLVADGGQPLGAVGAVQGDARFGDVRVAAAPEGPEMIAAAAPFSFVGSTVSGDLLFNSTAPFRIGDGSGTVDLFSVALHEAGHVFGLDHSDAVGSVLNEDYRSHTGLSADDVAAIRAMYGVRAHDAFDAASRNDTLGRASALAKVSGTINQFAGVGDLTTTGDVDVYRVKAPLLGLFGLSVRLKAEGVSLVTPRVTVLDGFGRVLTSAATTDPLNNDVSVRLPWVTPGATYYVKVEGATEDAFGVGAYQVVADFLAPLATLPLVPDLLAPITDGHTNDLLHSATALVTSQGATPDSRFDYVYRAAIEDSSDVDTYKVVAPTTPGTAPMNLNVLVWGTGSRPLDPRVKAFDAAGKPVAVEVLANDRGLMSVQVVGATPGATYYLQVAARTPTGANDAGGYVLAADFNRLAPVRLDTVASTTLAAGTARDTTLTITDAGVFEFGLSADEAGATGVGVTMTVFDAAGNVVFGLTAGAGDLRATRVQYLAAGTYRVRLSYVGGTSVAPPLRADVVMLNLSEQVGPYGTKTTSPPPPPEEDDYYWCAWEEGYAYEGSSNYYSYDNPYYY